jgi:hypothetical protein
MLSIFYSLLRSLRAWFRSKAKVQLEIISLRHQLAVTYRQNPKPRLTAVDRCLWVWFSRNLSDWRSVLLIVKPDNIRVETQPNPEKMKTPKDMCLKLREQAEFSEGLSVLSQNCSGVIYRPALFVLGFPVWF